MQYFGVIAVCCIVCACCVPIREKYMLNVPCGVEASSNPLHHNPWLVYLEYYTARGRRGFRCAGSLIDARHVITAAHCVRKGMYDRLVVRLGEYDLQKVVDNVDDVIADPVIRIFVDRIRIHDAFDGIDNDIAVLVLEEKAPYTDFIRPICLPTSAVKKGDLLQTSGWGEIATTHIYSHVKKNISLPSWSLEECRKVYKTSKLHDNVICAGGEYGIDSCRGDSGGPLTRAVKRIELVGVTSSGYAICGTEGTPGIYTSVKSHLGWIRRILRESYKVQRGYSVRKKFGLKLKHVYRRPFM